jgi:hypothetical protein
MQPAFTRSKMLLVGAIATSSLTLVATAAPAQAASTASATNTYTVTIDTTEHLHFEDWRGRMRFLLTGADGVKQYSRWMGPVERSVLRVKVEEGQSALLDFWTPEHAPRQISLHGKRYLRVGGIARNPDICGWKSFASRDAGHAGMNLRGFSMGRCTW